jgi:hypothetical protein
MNLPSEMFSLPRRFVRNWAPRSHTQTHKGPSELGREIVRKLQRPSLEIIARNCRRPAVARAARTGPGQTGRPAWPDNCCKSSASGMRTQSDVRSCKKGNEGEQNLPEAARKRETARHCRAPRGAADLSGPRSAPRRPRHNCRSVARTLYKKLGPQDDEGDKRPADRTPAGRVRRSGIVALESNLVRQTPAGKWQATDRTVPRILSSIRRRLGVSARR